jgi:hypothetical protein
VHARLRAGGHPTRRSRGRRGGARTCQAGSGAWWTRLARRRGRCGGAGDRYGRRAPLRVLRIGARPGNLEPHPVPLPVVAGWCSVRSVSGTGDPGTCLEPRFREAQCRENDEISYGVRDTRSRHLDNTVPPPGVTPEYW